MKSTSTCPFFESLDLYWMLYSLSSIAQRAILPDKLGLCVVLRRGRSVNTTMRCAWKYGRSFLAAIWRARAACSRWLYLVSASAKDLLMKNIGLCFPSSFSLNSAALTAISEIARSTNRVSPVSGLAMIGGSAKYCLI